MMSDRAYAHVGQLSVDEAAALTLDRRQIWIEVVFLFWLVLFHLLLLIFIHEVHDSVV